MRVTWLCWPLGRVGARLQDPPRKPVLTGAGPCARLPLVFRHPMTSTNNYLFEDLKTQPTPGVGLGALVNELHEFTWRGKPTVITAADVTLGERTFRVPVFVNEYWTSRQRAAHSLHEISYRACFKPQLPRFFIERLTGPGDVVYDPFMGRGTTVLEAALLGRAPVGCDINPLSPILVAPRLRPPAVKEVADRLSALDLSSCADCPADLEVFYHPKTLREICALKEHLLRRLRQDELDKVDEWIRMVAVSRLTGHSTGFFSVYTLPPNQAVSLDAQRKINRDRNQHPPLRDVRSIILKKTKSLLRDGRLPGTTDGQARPKKTALLTRSALDTPEIASDSVDLVVTSPPFLDVVNYATDNWLRCWFCGIDSKSVALSVLSKIEDWETAMTGVLKELRRVLRPGGSVAFEVGEVRAGTVKLEQSVVRCGLSAGLEPVLVLINSQHFTKTANCWGVANNAMGTNSNRVVLFSKA